MQISKIVYLKHACRQIGNRYRLPFDRRPGHFSTRIGKEQGLICRHCKSSLTLTFLDLGSAPPSNAYLKDPQLNAPEIWYPLRLLVCTECWLVQTEDYAGREALFTKEYAYFSSFSRSWLSHAKRYVAEMVERFGLNECSMVAEIAANDGYLLQYVKQQGLKCYGVEPTQRTAKAARAKGLEIYDAFFGFNMAEMLVDQGRAADLAVANNVLAHVPDVNDFISGFGRLLKPEGVATFEFPHLIQMVRHNQFDTAYHEHYSYLSLTSVERIFTANGLGVFDVQEHPTHGGSLRVFAQRADTGRHGRSSAVDRMLAVENKAGISERRFYTGFQKQAETVKNSLLTLLIQASQNGQKVGAYGAAAKGNTLLNFAGIRPDLLPWVADRNPAKQGTYLPGSKIPIVDEAKLNAERPDLVLILPWNLWEEVTHQLDYIREWDGRFVKAVPELEIL